MAFIQEQLYPIPFSAGLDTGTDPKQVLAGNLLTLQNGVFDQTNQLNKRTGSTILSNLAQIGEHSVNVNTLYTIPTVIQSGVALNIFNNELLLFDDVNMYSYAEQVGLWTSKGMAVSIDTNERQIIRTSNRQQLNPDVAFIDNTELYAWEDTFSPGVRYSIIDTKTDSLVIADTPIGSYSVPSTGLQKPKCLAFNNLLFCLFTDGYSQLYYATVSPSNPTAVDIQVNLISDGYDLLNGFTYDATIINNRLYIAYLSNSTPTGTINVFYLDSSLSKTSVITIPTTVISSSSLCPINIVGDSSNNLLVTWSNGLNANSAIYNSSGTQLLAPTPITSSGNVISTIGAIQSTLTSKYVICLELYNATPYNTSVEIISLTNVTGALHTLGTVKSVGLASKPFNINGYLYVNIAYQTVLNPTYFTLLINNGGGTIIAKQNAGTGGGLRTNSMLSEVPFVGTNQVKYANLTKGAIISEGDTVFSLLGVNVTTLDYQSPYSFSSVTQSNNLLIVGGLVQMYDGVAMVEDNFNYPPENVTAIASGSGSGLSTGSYQYQVTYEWMDNNGNVHISTPSPIVTVNVTTGQVVTLTIPTLRLTAKYNVSVVIYRTVVNGTVFQECTNILAPLENDTTSDTVSFEDELSDLSLESNKFIYTTGNVLSNVAPPACSLMTLFQDRVIIAGLEDKNSLWFSQNKQNYTNYSTTPTNFAAELTIGCDPLGGPVTAIKNLDQNLVIFKKTNIFIVNGDGPNNTGGGNSYPNPQMLASDVGCNNQNSIVICPLGLLFQSDKGIYQLDRGLNTSYIGKPVQQYNNEVITSSSLLADKNRVLFTTQSGTTLVYDYYVNQWSTFTNQNAADSVIFQNEFTWIQSDGYVYESDNSVYTDGYDPIYMSWTTPNLKFAQINGYQRVFYCMILGTYKSAHTLNIQVAYDDSLTYTQTATLTPTNTTPYQYRIDFKQQECSSIRLMISDSQTAPYNEGYAISAMTFQVGVIPGLYKIPATQTTGTS